MWLTAAATNVTAGDVFARSGRCVSFQFLRDVLVLGARPLNGLTNRDLPHHNILRDVCTVLERQKLEACATAEHLSHHLARTQTVPHPTLFDELASWKKCKQPTCQHPAVTSPRQDSVALEIAVGILMTHVGEGLDPLLNQHPASTGRTARNVRTATAAHTTTDLQSLKVRVHYTMTWSIKRTSSPGRIHQRLEHQP